MSQAPSTSETHWLDEQQQAQWRAFLGGTTVLFERLDRDLREQHNLSMPEYEILVRLSEAPDRRMRMAVLADSVTQSRSRTTHTIARLQTAGLVERTASPEELMKEPEEAEGGEPAAKPKKRKKAAAKKK